MDVENPAQLIEAVRDSDHHGPTLDDALAGLLVASAYAQENGMEERADEMVAQYEGLIKDSPESDW